MTIFHFGRHSVPFSDIRDISVEYRYSENALYVDLELTGGGQLSLNLDDSLTFMEQFIVKVREERGA